MRVAFAFLALLALTAAKPAPKPVDWSRTVARAPSGGFVIGNPAAKVRLVEYMSYTCGHCAQFAADSRMPLARDWLARGRVSFEIRNFVLNGLDFTAALAARCAGPARFKGNHDAIFAAQASLLEKGGAFDASKHGTNPVVGMKAWARASGLTALMATRGVPAAALDRCIADPKEQARIQSMTRDAAETRKLPGTPYFFLNDRALATNKWSDVEIELRAATSS